jgi:hypothetical protein
VNHNLCKLKNINSVNRMLTSFLVTHNQFYMNTVNGTLSPADGSATIMLFTHGCGKGKTFPAPDKEHWLW